MQLAAAVKKPEKRYQTPQCLFSPHCKDFDLRDMRSEALAATSGMIRCNINQSINQIFHYTCCITPKRVTSLRGPSPRHCARATQLFLKKCRSGVEPLTTLCPI